MDADWMDLLDEKNKEIERLQKQIRYQDIAMDASEPTIQFFTGTDQAITNALCGRLICCGNY